MRLPSWLAAFSVVVAIGAASAFAVHGQAAHVPALTASRITHGGAAAGLVAFEALVTSDQLRLASAPPSRAPVTQAPVQRPPAAPRPVAPSFVIGSAQQALINRDRAAAGLRPLTWSSCLASIAASNAVRMARQGYISHTNGASQDLGCHLGNQAGENVGWWSGGINDGQLNTMFMNSPEHRANIMGPYRYVGTAWAVAPNGYAYIAVEFG